MSIEDDDAVARIEEEKTQVEAEFRPLGLTWNDLFDHVFASNERPGDLPSEAKFFVMVPFGELLAALLPLPDNAGRAAFIAAMTARANASGHSDPVA